MSWCNGCAVHALCQVSPEGGSPDPCFLLLCEGKERMVVRRVMSLVTMTDCDGSRTALHQQMHFLYSFSLVRLQTVCM
jgi:hypothetical protein